MQTTADRWTLTVAALSGEPPPPPPSLPGRVHKAPREPDVSVDACQVDRELEAAAIWRALALDGEGDAAD